jgi:hypothetical protein
MTIVAFDVSEFKRWKKVEDKKEIVFFTPLGIGVIIKNGKEGDFKSNYHILRKNLINKFNVPTKRLVYSHGTLWKEIGHAKAIKFCDGMITGLQDFIERIFCSYVILPPKDIESVPVGGYGCPIDEISTMKFLRSLTPMFSYITAWSYSGRYRSKTDIYLIDGFSSKETTAWNDLKEHTALKIYPRGDECNEFISVADMLAYLTEKKLWDKKLWLTPENIEEAWKGYNFPVETRFLDQRVLSKIKWYSKQEISVDNFLAHPMVFMDIEGVSIDDLSEPVVSAAAYACYKGGAFQGFDRIIDSSKIKDGDVYVYAGEESKRRADSFKDMYDIEILSVKELRIKTQGLLE